MTLVSDEKKLLLKWRDGDKCRLPAEVVASENEIWVYGNEWCTVYEMGSLLPSGALEVGNYKRQHRLDDPTYVVRPTSCRCGGSWAYYRIRSSGAEESVGCICHHQIPDMAVVDITLRVRDSLRHARNIEAFLGRPRGS